MMEREEELGWRRLLWLHHGHQSVIYGDDGEMQCAACMLDFKRHSLQYIEERFHQRAIQNAKLPEAQAFFREMEKAGRK